jgi:DNA-binding beta-propeller fold protein YncE
MKKRKLLIPGASLVGAVIVGALVLATASAHPRGVPGGTIWVTERSVPGQSTVAAIDSRTGESRGIVPVGDLPIGITVPRGTHKAYSSDETANQMSVIDEDTVTVLRTIPMGPGSRPHHLMASRNGRRIYVGEYGTNKVGVVDTRLDLNVIDFTASSNPNAKTHAVWITPNERWLYATNEGSPQSGPGTFSKLNAKTGELIWEHGVGNRPSEVLVSRRKAFVSVRNDNVIRVYDVRSNPPVFVGQAEANFMPDTLSLTNDRRTLIVGLRGTPARMAFIDTRTLATQYLELPGFTTGHQWLSRDSRFTFIALEGFAGPPPTSGQIAVVDNRSRTLLDTYPYPNGKRVPHGVFYTPREPNDEDDDDDD